MSDYMQCVWLYNVLSYEHNEIIMLFCRRAALTTIAMAIVLLFLFLSLPRMFREMLYFFSSRTSRKIFGGPSPFACNIPPHELHEYFVNFANGYSLEEHKQAVGRGDDLDRVITHSYAMSDPYLGTAIVYGSKFNDLSLLEAVRLNYGVLWVECHGRIHLSGH